MTERKDQILKRLADEGAKAAQFFRGLRPPDWEQVVYTTGGRWRVREVLCHFVSTEVLLDRFGRDILAGGLGAPEDFVIDEFNETQVGGLADRDPAGLVAEFEQRRAATLAFVRGLADSDLDRVGRHPWFGLAPLDDMLKLMYRHTMLHLRDARRAIASGRPAPHVEAAPPSAQQV